jgi:hypothetical protein
MPIDITLHESGLYMMSVYRGRIRDEEIIPAYEAFYVSTPVPVNIPELVDLSAADLSALTREGLAALVRWGERLMTSRGELGKKTAVYVPAGMARSKVVIYEVLAQGSPEIVQTFTKPQPAVDWLTGKAAVSS